MDNSLGEKTENALKIRNPTERAAQTLSLDSQNSQLSLTLGMSPVLLSLKPWCSRVSACREFLGPLGHYLGLDHLQRTLPQVPVLSRSVMCVPGLHFQFPFLCRVQFLFASVASQQVSSCCAAFCTSCSRQ